MKRNNIILIIAVSLFIIFTGCSKSNNPVSNNTGNGGIGGVIGGGTTGGGNNGGGNGAITFSIRSEAGQNGGSEFDAEPSANITLTQINVEETSGTGFTDQIQGDGTTVYQTNTWYKVSEYTGVQSGMKFTFEFIGKTSPAGTDFDVTSNYTVP